MDFFGGLSSSSNILFLNFNVVTYNLSINQQPLKATSTPNAITVKRVDLFLNQMNTATYWWKHSDAPGIYVVLMEK